MSFVRLPVFTDFYDGPKMRAMVIALERAIAQVESRSVTRSEKGGKPVFDDYEQAVTLDPHVGADDVAAFDFGTNEVQLILVHPLGVEALVAWVRVDENDPAAAEAVGMPAPANQGSHFFGNRKTIDVYVPTGLTVYITGYRRITA